MDSNEPAAERGLECYVRFPNIDGRAIEYECTNSSEGSELHIFRLKSWDWNRLIRCQPLINAD
jgi:hypothetical protein